MKDFRFYTLIILGFTIAMVGLLAPPIGVISNSVLLMTGQFIILAGGVIGCVIHLDFKNMFFHVGKTNTDLTDKTKKEDLDESSD